MAESEIEKARREAQEAMDNLAALLPDGQRWSRKAVEIGGLSELRAAISRLEAAAREDAQCPRLECRSRREQDEAVAAARLAGIEKGRKEGFATGHATGVDNGFSKGRLAGSVAAADSMIRAYHAFGIDGMEREQERLRREAAAAGEEK